RDYLKWLEGWQGKREVGLRYRGRAGKFRFFKTSLLPSRNVSYRPIGCELLVRVVHVSKNKAVISAIITRARSKSFRESPTDNSDTLPVLPEHNPSRSDLIR